MTYLPTKPPGTAPNAGPLSDADLLPLSQAGVTRRATLATLKAFVVAGATGSTGATGGTTGSTGGTGGLYTYPEGTSGPYGGIGDTGTGAGPQAYLYGRSLGDLFGTYTYPNPGGLDNGYSLKHCLDKLIGVAGVKPKTMNAFCDFVHHDNTTGQQYLSDLSLIGGGTFAYGWASDTDAAEISGPAGYLRPIIGVKLGAQVQGYDDPATYDAIVNGTYDSQYLTELNAWISKGYKKLTYRYAYEFNGTFMPDYMGGNATDNARFAAALRHVILLNKNRCAQAGVDVKFSFNPTYINGTDTDVMNAWPGDDVIDIIDCDQYNPCYPRYKTGGYQNFNADGTPTGTYEQDMTTWITNPNNRIKFWNYPGIKDNYSGDNHDYDPGGWSALRTIAVAKQKGKAIAFSECGTGKVDVGNSLYYNYYGNDPVWVRWFWGICQSAISQGVPIAHMNIWNIYAGDGQWEYSSPDTYDPQPDVALAYRKYFGDGSYAGGPTPVSGDGTVPVIGGSSTGSTGSTGNTSGTGGTGGAGSTGTTAGVATAQVADTSGHSATITLNVGYKTYYQNETGLGLDIYYYLDGGTNKPTIGSSADAQVASMVITQNGTATVSSPGLSGVTTYSGGGSTASTGASGGTGVATVVINDNAGNTANLTLNQSYRDYYGSGNDTSLTCNIYYYADAANNNTPTIGSSADSQIASMTITRNGTTTVASGGLAGVTTYA